MNLRTYRAKSMPEALAEVKRDLGRDAVILHTRTIRVGGVLGVGSRGLVEVTASDSPPGAAERPLLESPDEYIPSAAQRPASRARAAVPAAPAAPPLPAAPAAAPARAAAGRPRAATPTPERMPVVHTCRTAADEFRAFQPRPLRAPQSPPGADPPGGPGPDAREDLAAIRRMLAQVIRRTAAPAPAREGVVGAAPGPLTDCYLRLLESEVAAEIAEEVMGRVRAELPARKQGDAGAVRAAVLKQLAALVPAPAHEPAPERAPDGRPLTLALVGPTGVGKTTTVAKLAAAYKLRHGRKVGLVTTDTYRIAAVDQLRVYAEIIGVPLKVAMTPQDMQAACAALADRDVVLIDTAGRSPRDAARLADLAALLEAAAPHHVHLVLAGTAAEGALLEAASQFAGAKPDRVIFTKLDEAVNFGVLVSVAHRLGPRLSHLTTGQEVPDHIEPASAERLAGLVMDGWR